MFRMLCVAAFAAFFITPAVARGIGTASWYGGKDGLCGHRTASGERFNCRALTAAHRSLPFGTKVRLTNTKNGCSVIVRISDRGPFVRGRDIDVSPAAKKALCMSGLAKVKIDIIK